MIKKIAIILFITFTFNFTHALTSDEKGQIRSFSDLLPSTVCQQIFKICFLWNKEDCMNNTKSMTQNCLKDFEAEWSKSDNENYKFWQKRMMDCVFQGLKTKFPNKYRNIPQCQPK